MLYAMSLLATACSDSGIEPEPQHPRPVVARVEVSPSAVSMMQGETRALSAQALDADGHVLEGRTATWVSANPTVAAVDATGRLQAKTAGIVVVTVTVEERSANVLVTVLQTPAGSIGITPTALVLGVGATRQLRAIVRDAAGNELSGRPVVWTTDVPTVATISQTGVVTAIGPGYVTITATSEGMSTSIGGTVTQDETDLMPFDLVYHRTTPGALGEIFILGTAAGSSPIRLNAGTVSRQPTASPDGNRIAFYVSQTEFTGERTEDIFAVDRNGMNVKRLTNEPGYDDQPAWSPVASRIAYRHHDPTTGRSDIWVMNADGSQKTNLTPEHEQMQSVGSPAWSPDGTHIAFAALQAGATGFTGEIWTMNADGSDKRLITHSLNAADRDPTWSPSGTQIAFIRAYGDDTDITLVNAAGGTTVRLTLPGRQEGPAWSPDGRHLAYWQQVDNLAGTAIFTVRADGTNVRLHTTDPKWGGGYDPSWIRRP